ncbi:MAG: VacJ family lipoprotein [Methylococcales bacterium]
MRNKRAGFFTGFILLTALNGCSTTPVVDERDPFEAWNRKVYSVNEKLDDYAMKPVAKAYRWITPSFVDKAVTNVFSNIDDIGVTINSALQGKFSQSGWDFSRFIVNSTVGVGGMIDVASMIELDKHDEDFGQTLGYWGVPTGPYIVLPLLGASSARGIFGLVGDAAMDPTSYFTFYIPGSTFYITASANALKYTDIRADYLGTEAAAEEASVFGKYEFYRNSYLSKRKALVTDSVESDEDDLLLNYE